MKITVNIKNNYGTEAIYPICSNAEHFAELAGTKTLTRHAIATIKKLGYEIEVQQKKVEL